MERPKKRTARKLLGVTLGLASLSFVGSACTTGNLVAPDVGPPDDAAPSEDTGTAPDDAGGATDDAGGATEDAGG
jgi:hypothetical protein